MRCFLNTLILLAVISWLLPAAMAQRSKDPAGDDNEKSEVRIGIRYTSDYLYLGRSDSAKAPYLSPSIGYFHKTGFFVSGSLSYLLAEEERRVDLYRLSGGYDYHRAKIATGLSVTEYFFNDLSDAVQAEMDTYLNGYFSYDFSSVIFYVDTGLGFSEGTDIFLGAEIDYPLYAFKDRLRIIPSLSAYAGSQQYYNEYYMWRSVQTGSGVGKRQGGQHHSTYDTQVLESSKFKILDYEADLYLAYKIKRLLLFASATWAFPVNPSTIVVDQATYEEGLDNRFYWSSGIRFIY